MIAASRTWRLNVSMLSGWSSNIRLIATVKRDIWMCVRLKKYCSLVAGSVICCEHAEMSAEETGATGSEIAIEENEHAHVGTRRNAGDIWDICMQWKKKSGRRNYIVVQVFWQKCKIVINEYITEGCEFEL